MFRPGIGAADAILGILSSFALISVDLRYDYENIHRCDS